MCVCTVATEREKPMRPLKVTICCSAIHLHLASSLPRFHGRITPAGGIGEAHGRRAFFFFFSAFFFFSLCFFFFFFSFGFYPLTSFKSQHCFSCIFPSFSISISLSRSALAHFYYFFAVCFLRSPSLNFTVL